MKNLKSTQKRGAQAGNTNALKHGFYSAQFQPAEVADLKKDAPPVRYAGLQGEIDMLRVFLRRTIEAVNAEENLTVETRLRALDVISKAAARLAHLTSVHHLVTIKIPSQEEAQLTRQLINITRHSANVLLKAAHLEQLGPTQEEKDLQLGRELDEILQRCDPQPEEPPSPTPPENQTPPEPALPPERPVAAAPERHTDPAAKRRRHTPTRNLASPQPTPPEEEPLPGGGDSPWLPEDAFETYLTTI